MAQQQPQQQSSYVGTPVAVPGKMVFKDHPTPGEDRIFLVRRDTRKPDYVEPAPFAKYDGPDADNPKYCDLFYVSFRTIDQVGWIDQIYMNDRLNQDDYNGEITYPYVDKDYPMVTRTYVFRRGDQRADEPEADSNDPVFSDLKLTDHKVFRIGFNDNQIAMQGEWSDTLDHLFVGIQRVYERLPGPVIRTYDVNAFQQVVYTDTQTVQTESVPTPDAVTETDKTARTGTAKAQVVLGTVDSVFPNTKFSSDRGEHSIPFKFRAAVPAALVWSISAGTAATPVLAQNEWAGEEQQTTLYKKTSTRTVHDIGAGVSLVDYKLTNDQQVATITDTWLDTAQTITPVALLTEASVDSLGNGDTILSETTVPSVFDKRDYTMEIPDAVPEKFRVLIPITTSAITGIGSAAPITSLGTGELSREEQQLTEFWRRVSVRGRDISSLPVSLVSYKQTRDKQIETITETMDAGLQTLTPSALVVEEESTNLGNNTSILYRGTVPSVFPADDTSTSIPDLTPQEFRAFVPLETLASTAAGTVTIPPVLATGELSRKEQQLDEYTFRRSIEVRSTVSLPITHTNAELTSEFGGDTTTVSYTLAVAGTSTLDQGLLVLKSSIKNLGNGTEIKETQEADGPAWPIVESRLWDENSRVEYDETKQVVAAGSSESSATGGDWGFVSEVKGLDQWRSIRINTRKPEPDYVDEGSALISYEMKPFRFPGYLQFSGTGYYTRNATAVLVQHEIKTWWEKSGSTPTVSFNEIVTDDVIINNLANTGLEYARSVLHDGFTFGTLSFPATTPTATEYSLGTVSGSVETNFISLYSPGTGYTVGNVLSISGDGGAATITVEGTYTSGSVLNWSPYLCTTCGWAATGIYGPYTASGGSGSGAAFYVSAFDYPTYSPGTAWIGSSRVIAASVTPEKEKNIWKIQTESVIMR